VRVKFERRGIFGLGATAKQLSQSSETWRLPFPESRPCSSGTLAQCNQRCLVGPSESSLRLSKLARSTL